MIGPLIVRVFVDETLKSPVPDKRRVILEGTVRSLVTAEVTGTSNVACVELPMALTAAERLA
jgi:hypothetical protein